MSGVEYAAASESGVSTRQKLGWLYLVYLAIPALQPLFDAGATWLDWALVAGVIVAFVPMYTAAMWRPARARWWCTVPATVLGAVTAPLNAGTSVLFVYAAATAGVSESRRVALRWFAGLTVLVSVVAVFSTVPMPWRMWGIVPSLLFIWLIGLMQIEEAEQARERGQLRLHNAKIEHLATISERERIARDLHDLLGHSLTSVVLRAQLIKELVDADPARARTEAEEVERIARDALSEVRTAVSGWRQASVDSELESARSALSAVGVELTVHAESGLAITSSTEHELALALREAVTNVARHAGARTCHVRIESADGEVRVVVADDGIGGNAREGNGLAGMRERISALGGSVRRLGSAGTTLTIAVPLEVAT